MVNWSVSRGFVNSPLFFLGGKWIGDEVVSFSYGKQRAESFVYFIFSAALSYSFGWFILHLAAGALYQYSPQKGNHLEWGQNLNADDEQFQVCVTLW